MNCGFCGKHFDEDRGQSACRHCPVGSGCGLVRCPHCGYENPGMPGWIAFLKKHVGGGERPRVSEEVTAETVGAPASGPTGLHLPVIHSRN